MNNTTDFPTIAFFVLLGMILTVLLYLSSPAKDANDFMESHKGLRELVAEMRETCETQEGVVSCKWDADKRDYVPADN